MRLGHPSLSRQLTEARAGIKSALHVRVLQELFEQTETDKNVDAGVQYNIKADVFF